MKLFVISGTFLKTFVPKSDKDSEEFFYNDSENWIIEEEEEEEEEEDTRRPREVHEQYVDDKCWEYCRGL